MRITERRLRSLIKSIIIENVINQNNYTFEFADNLYYKQQEVKKSRDLEGAQIVSAKEPSNKRLKNKTFLLVRIPSKNGNVDMGVILYQDKHQQYQQAAPKYLEFDMDLRQNILVPEPFDDVKKDFERKTKGDELFKLK